jgi:enamine deaminase RidA (YjgF/YER057c/UK114 family)
MSPEEKLMSLGIELPTPAKAVANYVPWVRSGNLVFVSGQLPFVNGALFATGVVGVDCSLDTAVQAARIAAINIIAQLQSAADGDLTRVKRIVKITGFVASAQNFVEHPKIINGASDLFVDVFGDKGRHARAAVGVCALPLNACVEIEAIAELE